MDLQGFNAEEHEQQDFSAIPAGKYTAVIVSSEEKEMKSGKGVGINFQFEIVSEQFKGRRIFKWINWTHENPKAQEIGRGELSSICKATGILNPGSTEDLHDKPVLITVKVEIRKDNGEESNRITYVASASKSSPSKPKKSSSKPAWKDEAVEDDVPY